MSGVAIVLAAALSAGPVLDAKQERLADLPARHAASGGRLPTIDVRQFAPYPLYFARELAQQLTQAAWTLPASRAKIRVAYNF